MYDFCSKMPQGRVTITVHKPPPSKLEEDLRIIEIDEDLYNSNGFSQGSFCRVSLRAFGRKRAKGG